MEYYDNKEHFEIGVNRECESDKYTAARSVMELSLR